MAVRDVEDPVPAWERQFHRVATLCGERAGEEKIMIKEKAPARVLGREMCRNSRLERRTLCLPDPLHGAPRAFRHACTDTCPAVQVIWPTRWRSNSKLSVLPLHQECGFMTLVLVRICET